MHCLRLSEGLLRSQHNLLSSLVGSAPPRPPSSPVFHPIFCCAKATITICWNHELLVVDTPDHTCVDDSASCPTYRRWSNNPWSNNPWLCLLHTGMSDASYIPTMLQQRLGLVHMHDAHTSFQHTRDHRNTKKVDQWLETSWKELEVPAQALAQASGNQAVISEAKRHLLSFLGTANDKLSTRCVLWCSATNCVVCVCLYRMAGSCLHVCMSMRTALSRPLIDVPC